MEKKLYVGNLSYDMDDRQLEEAFAAAGSVTSAKVMADRMTGRSRGFGFVEMATEEDAEKAIEMMNGKEFNGRALKVNEARPMADRPQRDFNRDRRF